MRLLKILISMLIVMAMLFSFAACTTPKDPATNDGTPDTSDPGDTTNPGDTTDPGDTTNPGGSATPEIPATTVTLKEFLSAMKESPYKLKDKITDGVIGLSDSKNVGVDQERFENEVLYPVPSDGEFVKIYKAKDYGISPENENNSMAINDLIKEAKKVDGLKKIEFAPGVYPCSATLVFDGVNDLYFCCSDTTQYFEIRMTSWTQAFRVNDCDNLHINNYELDYDPSPTISGTIKSYDYGKKEIVIVIEDEFDLTHPLYKNGNLNPNITGGQSYLEFTTDPITGAPIPDPTKNLEGISQSSYDHASRCLTITVPNMVEPNVGARVSIAFTMYQHFGFYASGCGDIYIENARIYTTCGMAYGADTTKGIYVNDVALDLREGSKRLMTATADGFHTCDVQNVKITNSIFQYSHDDAFNIKNSYIEVSGVVNKKITILAGESYAIEPGDVIDIYTNEHFKPFGPYTVTRVERKTAKSVDVYVDKRVDEDADGGLMANLTKSTKLIIDNNIIGNKRNRGILLQTQGAVIKNNTWRNIVHGGVIIFTIKDNFAEGICPADVDVENNKFLGNYHGDISLYTWGTKGTTAGLMKDINIRNNFIYGTRMGGITVSGMGEGEVTNNLLYNICSAIGSGGEAYALSFKYSTNVAIRENAIYLDNGVERLVPVVKSGTNSSINESKTTYKNFLDE